MVPPRILRWQTYESIESRQDRICLVGFSCALNAQTRTYAIKSTRLFDGIGSMLLEPGLEVVFDGKIQSVGGRTIPPGATLVDLGEPRCCRAS
jgi:hypothetical protein